MATTNFVSGTVVASSWLNDVDAAVYGDTTTPFTMPVSDTARASFRIPHGVAPTSPVDGDMWTTTAGLYIRINGTTVGPLS